MHQRPARARAPTRAALTVVFVDDGLELAVEHGLKSIAFPAISTGVYGYPSASACKHALEAVRKFMDGGKADELERIVFCNFLDKDQEAYLDWQRV